MVFMDDCVIKNFEQRKENEEFPESTTFVLENLNFKPDEFGYVEPEKPSEDAKKAAEEEEMKRQTAEEEAKAQAAQKGKGKAADKKKQEEEAKKKAEEEAAALKKK